MTTINRASAIVAGSARSADGGPSMQFADVNTSGSGRISHNELEIALNSNFPDLSDQQAQLLTTGVFARLDQNGAHLDASAWQAVGPALSREAAGLEQSNIVNGGSGWLNATGLPAVAPMMVGMQQIPLSPAMFPGAGYMPRNDFAMTGFNPYQYPMNMPPMLNGRMPGMPGYETPIGQAAKGAGRGIIGFLKMMPVVGNVLNGIDFIRDIGKGLSTWANPTKTFGEKIKSTADLLFHGAGMFVPQVGGAYDMAQGAVRVGEGMMRMGGGMGMGMGMGMRSPFGMLPPFNYAMNGLPNMYAMQNLNPMAMNPLAFNQFPNYSMYPPFAGTNPAFMPSYLGGPGMFRQPFPMMPYGAGNMFGPGMMMNDRLGTPLDGIEGAVRTGVGAVKMAPGLGNILNGIDFIRDIGHLFSASHGDPRHSFLKTAADLLFHGVGMIVPKVVGAYDMAQGSLRMGAAALNPMNHMNPMMNPMMMNPMMNPAMMGMLGGLPPFGFNRGAFPLMYNQFGF